jgi:DNA-binding FadR family transcriptional regulator
MTNPIPQNTPLYEKLVKILETKIIDGYIQIGDKLPTENELAETYKVSRTVIREAMKALKERGWVETRVAKGTFVTDKLAKGVGDSFDVVVRMNPENGFDHLIEVREMIEPEIAALAAMRVTDEQIQKLQAEIDLMEAADNNPDGIEKFSNADYNFHIILAETTGNPLILMILNPVVKLMRVQQRYHVYRVEGGLQKSQQNHRLIMAAIKSHDPDAARRYMRQHIHQVRKDVESQTDSSNNDVKSTH